VRIDLVEGKSVEYGRGIGDIVYNAMVDVLKVPKDDRFQVIAERPQQFLIADEKYLGVKRTKDCVFIQITLNAGRSVDQKRAFYRAVANGLHFHVGVRTEDVFISLVEVPKENWSFGNGEAQYAAP
jgi:phenylpyruvate tautomerase PptA (4-oxalocrotonate tautomerase family)